MSGIDYVVKRVIFALMTVLVAASMILVVPRMNAIRAEASEPMSALVAEHPLRTEFGRLHGFSALLMLGQLVLGAAALGIPIRGWPQRTTNDAERSPPTI
jgi:hypothetical protein